MTDQNQEENTESEDLKDYRNEEGKFIKGNPGGPGRPKGTKIISAALREMLEGNIVKLTLDFNKNGKVTKKEYDLKSNKSLTYAISAALIEEAINGNIPAIKEITDRIEGRAVNAVVLDGHLSSDIASMTREDREKRIAELLDR